MLPVYMIATAFVSTGAGAFDCVEKYCPQMSSCAEAHYHLLVCREQQRDADNDGIPCENVCGKTLEEYRRLRGPDAKEQPAASQAVPEPSPQTRSEMTPPGAGMQCTGKRRCGDMLSCEEARFYLSNCGVRSLDRDGDGVPCESLCGGR